MKTCKPQRHALREPFQHEFKGRQRWLSSLVMVVMGLLWAVSPAMGSDTLTVSFPADTPSTYQQGSGRSIPLSVSGTSSNMAVVVSAVDNRTRSVVASFNTVLRGRPWEIPASALDKLPAGSVTITVQTLRPARKVQHTLQVLAPRAGIGALSATNITVQAPTFINPPATYTRGSGLALPFHPGTVGQGYDVLVIAWSITNHNLVMPFGHAVKAAPWAITADKLDLLPPGEVELQLIIRRNYKPLARTTHLLSVIVPGDRPSIQARFPQGFPASYVRGSGADLSFEVQGALPAGGDVLVLAWSDARKAMVSSFAQVFTGPPYRLDNAQLDALPEGPVELQLLPRVHNKILAKVTRDITVQSPAQPTAAFASDFPSTYEQGSNAALNLVVENLPAGGDVLVLAWSDSRMDMVDGFAHTLTKAPWRISNAKLDGLPAGRANLQLLVRVNNKVLSKVTRNVTIKAVAPPAPEPEPQPDPAPQPSPRPDPDGGVVVTPPPGGGGQVGPKPTPGDEPTPAPPVTPFTATFAANAASQYTIGSKAKYVLETTGTLPAGADVLILCWSYATKSMRDDVAHTLTQPPFEITSDYLDRIPVGMAQLQAAVRLPGQTQWQMSRLNIVVEPDPNAPAPPPPAPEPTPPPTPGPGDLKWVEPVVRLPAGTNLRQYFASLPGRRAMTIVLQAGGVYDLDGAINWRTAGESATRPIILTVEPGGARAIIRTHGKNGIIFGNNVEHVVVHGVHLHANVRDPDSPQFNGGNLYEEGIKVPGPANNLVFDDIEISHFTFGMVIQDWADNGGALRIRNVAVRRSYIHDCYAYGAGKHSSGIFGVEVDGLTIEDSLFDHNGWSQRVSASMRFGLNHNVYLLNCKNVTFRNNISARGSYMGLKIRSNDQFGITENLLVENNFFIHNAKDVGIGDNTHAGPASARNVRIVGNVSVQCWAEYGGDSFGEAITVMKTDGCVIERNLFTDKGKPDGSKFVQPAINLSTGTTMRNVRIAGNVIRWPSIGFYSGRPIALIAGDGRAITHSQVTLAGNLVNEPDSRFVDPGRTFASFARSVGTNGSIDDYIKKAASRKVGQVDPRFTAAAALQYFRKGFELIPFD